MLKPFTLSLSLAVALGVCSLGKAGLHNNYASGQCEAPSAQCLPSGQGCATPCAKKKCCLSGLGNLFKHKPKCYTYEWVLKKRRVHGHHGGGNACNTCGGGIYPTGQTLGSPQGGYGSAQAYGAGQAVAPAAMPAGTAVEAPPAPAAEPATSTPPPAPPTASNDGLLYLSPAGN